MADILRTIFDMRNGEVAADISRKWDEVLKAVLESRGKGELTIKLKIEPSKCAIGGAVLEVATSHECKLKKPELAVGQALFFVTSDGELTRDDPAQVAMFGEQEQKEKKRAN